MSDYDQGGEEIGEERKLGVRLEKLCAKRKEFGIENFLDAGKVNFRVFRPGVIAMYQQRAQRQKQHEKYWLAIEHGICRPRDMIAQYRGRERYLNTASVGSGCSMMDDGQNMPTIKHILFPFDFSTHGLLAVPFVRAIASRFGAKITLFSVLPPNWIAPPVGMGAFVAADEPELKDELQTRLDRELLNEFDQLTVSRVASYGDPAFKITEFAHENAVDLIMMPTHGSGSFRNLLLGSVTAKILHDTHCPVWTATHAEEQGSPDVPRTVLCAIDGTPETVPVLKWASEFSQRMGAALKVLHVVLPISDWLALPTERELQEQARKEARLKIESLLKSAGVDAPLRVAVGKIAPTVDEEARQEDANLVIIGRGSSQSTLGRLRTHAYGIIQQSPCPVLSV
jgi:nucleotide-binding universal stress UspA family protein